MSQIQKGTNYATGDTVTAANLNALVDGAALLPGVITDQAAKAVPLSADTVLVYSVADTALRKTTLAQIGANLTVTNATNATALATARNIQVSGAVTGTASFDGSANINIVTTLVAQTVPAGSVFNFAASTAPTGYLECSGAAVSRATYAALFAVTSTTFGVGDGSTTFNLPNLRGEFVRGWDNGRGVDASRAFGSAQADELKAHTHSVYEPVPGSTQAYAGGYAGQIHVQVTGSTGGVETRPRNIALLYCIKT